MAHRAETLAMGGLLLVAGVLRLAILALPALREPNYEEALVGLMARHILQGEHIVFWWGHPYLGTLDVYVVALLFALFGATTATLRLAPLLLSLAGAVVSYLTAQRLFGRRWALLALAWWALPPAFLARLAVTPYEYTAGVAMGNAVVYLTYRVVSGEWSRASLWYLLGAVSGLALWDHPIALCYLLGSGLALVLCAWRRAGPDRRLRDTLLQPGYARCAVGFVVGNSPFLFWNIRYRLETFTEMVMPAAGPGPGLLGRARALLEGRVSELLGRAQYFWHTRAEPSWNVWVAVAYLPVVAYGLYALVRARSGRAVRADRASHSDLGPAMAVFLLAWAQVLFTRYDQIRYLMPIYSALPLVFVGYVRWLSGWSPWLAGVAAVSVLALHAGDEARLVAGSRVAPEPVRGAPLQFLTERGISHVYAHYRVAWPLMFESRERVVAADYHGGDGFLAGKSRRGRRSGAYMKPYIDAVEAVDLAPAVALVTHEGLGLPRAAELDQALRLLGAEYQRATFGPYTVFHDFHPPVPGLREIDRSEVALHASDAADTAGLALDGDIGTAWTSGRPQAPGMFLEVELGQPRRVARIVLNPGPATGDYPRGVRVEVSRDGRVWEERINVQRHLGGIDWLNGHPKLNRHGKIAVWLRPVEAKWIRLTQTASPRGPAAWTVAELLLYEEDAPASPQPVTASLPAEEAETLRRALQAWGARAVYGTDEVNLVLRRTVPHRVQTVRWGGTWAEERRALSFDWRNAFLLPGPSPWLEQDLARRRVAFERRVLPSGVLYLTLPNRDAGLAYWDEGRLFRLGGGPGRE